MEIQNKVVLITGANRGIGLATAKMLAREGAHLHLANRSLDGADELCQDLSKLGAPSVQLHALDLSSYAPIEKFWQDWGEQPLDILFNNSGQLTGGFLETQSPQEIDQMLYVNVNALIHMTRFALKGMLKRKTGKIVNHSSVSAVMPFPGASTYAASKAAVKNFTSCLQYELTGTGVTALTLVTGSTETRMFQEIPKKYGSFLDVSALKGVNPDDYALRIREAIQCDWEELLPAGWEYAGYSIARWLPQLYQKGVRSKFRRP